MTLLRDVPSHGVYFGVYDWTRDALEPGCRAAGHQSHTTALIAGEHLTEPVRFGCALTISQGFDWLNSHQSHADIIANAQCRATCITGVGLRILSMWRAMFDDPLHLIPVQMRAQGKTGVLRPTGGLAGSTSWLSIYPIDVVKSRLQAHAAGAGRHRGWLHCVVRCTKYHAMHQVSYTQGRTSEHGCLIRLLAGLELSRLCVESLLRSK